MVIGRYCLAGNAARLALARSHVRVDGVATECGMTRGDPERFPALLAAHAQTATGLMSCGRREEDAMDCCGYSYTVVPDPWTGSMPLAVVWDNACRRGQPARFDGSGAKDA